jgi:hypothetical protein
MTHPNPDPYQRDSITSDTSPCPTCSWPQRLTVGMVCQTCGRDYAPDAYSPRIFDGPMTVLPNHVKDALGFEAGDEVRALEMSGVRLILVVTDADRGNAHLGGTAPVEEKLDLLRQVLAGLEALQ